MQKTHKRACVNRDMTHRKGTDLSTTYLNVCLNKYIQALMLTCSQIFVTNQTKTYLKKVKIGSSKHKVKGIYGRSTLDLRDYFLGSCFQFQPPICLSVIF